MVITEKKMQPVDFPIEGSSNRSETAQSSGEGPETEKLGRIIFVTGASRSGTTMLARLLGAHSRILALKELHFFGDIWEPRDKPGTIAEIELIEMAAVLFGRQQRRLWEGKPTDADREKARALVGTLVSQDRTAARVYAAAVHLLAAEAGKQIACEQTPRNIFYARQVLDFYPGARILHIVRDPRAVLASQKNRWRLRKLGAQHLPWYEMLRNWVNYHPITMTKLWKKATEEAVRLQNHDRVRIVRFEDLVANPEDGIRNICRFVGVDFEPPMLDVPRWGSSHLKAGDEEKGISSRVNDEWRCTLPPAHGLICERMAAPLMDKFDYTPTYGLDHSGVAMIPSLLLYPVHAASAVAFNPGRAWIQFRAIRRARD
jgi:hypothetical protein